MRAGGNRSVSTIHLFPRFAAAPVAVRPTKRRVFTAGISGIAICVVALGLARELHQKLSRLELFHPGAHEQAGLNCEFVLLFAFAPCLQR